MPAAYTSAAGVACSCSVNFGRKVFRRSDEPCEPSEGRSISQTSNAEVGEMHLVVVSHQNVLWFDVSMHNIDGVDSRQGV